MSSLFLANALYIIIGFTWVMYLIQEVFITGSSALNLVLAKDEQERKQIQYSSGLHWDGIEVWFIASVTILLGAFPQAFAMTYTYLYVVFYLLLYALITRGIVIETLYKMDSPIWVKWNARAWAISSALIIFLFGVYITNWFYGFPLESTGLTGSFFSIFSVTSIAGGLLFFALSVTAGAAWIALTTEGELGQRGLAFVKKIGFNIMVPVLLLLVFMGYNVADRLFVGELFTAYPVLFILPFIAFACAMLVLYFGLQQDHKKLFIFSLLTMAMFVIVGFVGMFPEIVPSNVDPSSSMIIHDVVTQVKSGQIIFIVAVVAFPVIIGYQVWKYKKFATKLAKDFE
ncbi:cytochrome d ubiquinol oxidase subunit II [Candidatus Xianfuyuplasma coldseepsis]|uniref:Cytochrome d ubiquinol oxidase subunit II n=1 Tax=Candidatus Xianfuyuplasma coldseepsis TaxID=2782163 RepID=A0A7L7KNP5_9MOLU|nr:cytochrome d ubiquinol oxidase subunit II [Xianfuyuplasma coldseepsis]QMS84293.1 hypothetical protein G4Z02_00570 [Xianfuyuplasma coldseepsis]